MARFSPDSSVSDSEVLDLHVLRVIKRVAVDGTDFTTAIVRSFQIVGKSLVKYL